MATFNVSADYLKGGGSCCLIGDKVIPSPLGLPKEMSCKFVYDVIRVRGGKLQFLQQHMARLAKSLAAVGGGSLPPGLEGLLTDLVAQCQLADQNVKVLLSEDARTCFAYPIESFYPPEEYYTGGVKAKVISYVRDCPNAKVLNLPLKEQLSAAMAGGIYELLLQGQDGDITEGSRSNVFCIVGGALVTAPVGAVLPGITREHVLALCKEHGIVVREERLTVELMNSASALFITSTSNGILPICTLGWQDGTEHAYDVRDATLVSLMKSFFS
eukprot:TRINITY_DN7348_c0_g1_i1.p1 TRINITY_DN7348_c0_g1~~TRINITY_DN7348_c0_g1_i1.p1  ORF type:complete len:272 (+),score=110.48 TRINITY_DN7348_c0_g1_i1:81-896(+)